MFQGPTFMEDIQIWSVPRQFWQRCNKWTQLGWWAMFRFRMHEGELQWSTLAVDLQKWWIYMNRRSKKLLEIWPQSRVPEDMEYRIETWTLSGLHETNKLGSSLGESARASVGDGRGPHCSKMFGAKAVSNRQGRTNQSLATEGRSCNCTDVCFGFDIDVLLLGGIVEPSTANFSIHVVRYRFAWKLQSMEKRQTFHKNQYFLNLLTCKRLWLLNMIDTLSM